MSKYSSQIIRNFSDEEAFIRRRKNHGRFRYETNRRFKDIENIRRVQKMLRNERSSTKDEGR